MATPAAQSRDPRIDPQPGDHFRIGGIARTVVRRRADRLLCQSGSKRYWLVLHRWQEWCGKNGLPSDERDRAGSHLTQAAKGATMKPMEYPPLAEYENRIRCDRHPQTGMVAVIIKGASPTGDLNHYRFNRCKLPTCTRHYSPRFGYFDTSEGDTLNVTVGEPKPRCGRHPETPAFFVENIDADTWRYSCPINECDGIESFYVGHVNYT